MFVSFTCEQGSFHHAWFVKGSPTTSTSLNSDLPVLPARPRLFPDHGAILEVRELLVLGDRAGQAVQKKLKKQATYVQWRLEIGPRRVFFFCVCVLFRWWFQTWKKWSERKEGKLTVRKLMSLSEGWNHRLELDLPLWLYAFEKKLCEEEMGSRNFWYEWPALRVLV